MTISGTMPRPRTIGDRMGMAIAPAAALLYPLTLKSFNDAVTSFLAGSGSYLPILGAVISLLLSFAVPAAAVVMALRLGAIENPTLAQLRARRVALLAVAAPTILVFLGVLVFMAGNPVPDVAIWTIFWIAALLFVLLGDNERLAPLRRQTRCACYSRRARIFRARDHRHFSRTASDQPPHRPYRAGDARPVHEGGTCRLPCQAG